MIVYEQYSIQFLLILLWIKSYNRNGVSRNSKPSKRTLAYAQSIAKKNLIKYHNKKYMVCGGHNTLRRLKVQYRLEGNLEDIVKSKA